MTARLGMMTLVLVTAILLHTVVLPSMAIGGWRPELVTLTVVAFALADGPGTGARYGFLAGLATDLLADGGQLVGVTALILLGVGYVVGAARPYLAGTTLAGQVAVAGAASGLAVLTHGILALVMDFSPISLSNLLRAAVVVAVYSAALAPFVLHPLMALSRRLPGAASAGAPMTVASYGPDR